MQQKKAYDQQSLKKYYVCLPESDFSIEFPVTFTFVPEIIDTTTVIADTATATTETSLTTENSQEQPIDCASGEKRITAFKCGPCPAGYNCKYSGNPTICEVKGSTNDYATNISHSE